MSSPYATDEDVVELQKKVEAQEKKIKAQARRINKLEDDIHEIIHRLNSMRSEDSVQYGL